MAESEEEPIQVWPKSNGLLGAFPLPWTWVSFFGGIQHSPGDVYSVASCNSVVLAGEDECMSFYSTILGVMCNNQ